MFHIKLDYGDIKISSIEKEDLESIYKWYVNEDISFKQVYGENARSQEEFYERFLEYYFSECEFFLKITNKGMLLGLIKGRIEFKKVNKVWINYVIVDHSLRGKGLGSKILNQIIKYFISECGIYNFYIKAKDKNKKVINFARKNNFFIVRYNAEKKCDINDTFIIFFKKVIGVDYM